MSPPNYRLPAPDLMILDDQTYEILNVQDVNETSMALTLLLRPDQVLPLNNAIDTFFATVCVGDTRTAVHRGYIEGAPRWLSGRICDIVLRGKLVTH